MERPAGKVVHVEPNGPPPVGGIMLCVVLGGGGGGGKEGGEKVNQLSDHELKLPHVHYDYVERTLL